MGSTDGTQWKNCSAVPNAQIQQVGLYFWQAIQIRYPEYATYNHDLYAMFGGRD